MGFGGLENDDKTQIRNKLETKLLFSNRKTVVKKCIPRENRVKGEI